MHDASVNHICTIDPKPRLIITSNGLKPSFNAKAAAEAQNHIIINFNVTTEHTYCNLLNAGIYGATNALEVIANKGYSSDSSTLICLLSGDTTQIYPNEGKPRRTSTFSKTSEAITREILGQKIISSC